MSIIFHETAYLALGQLRLDSGPRLALSSVGEQVHDNGALGDSLVNVEQVLSWDPAILLRLSPRCTVPPDANDDIETVIAEVETLAVTLGAVADEGESVVLEVLLRSTVNTLLAQYLIN